MDRNNENLKLTNARAETRVQFSANFNFFRQRATISDILKPAEFFYVSSDWDPKIKIDYVLSQGFGDVQAAIAAGMPNTGIDVLMGTGGAPEGVIAAAALKCVGGSFQGRLIFRHQTEIDRARKMGISDLNKIYDLEELAAGHVMFCATGVTDGSMLRGVKFFGGGARTHSIVMRSETGTIRFVETLHDFTKKPSHN